jgi:hypothetical protein
MNDHHHRTKRRILIVANESAEGSVLLEAIRELVCSSEAEVLVVAPERNSRLGHWMLATHSETRSHWLGRRLHLLVDPSRHAVGTAR